MNSIPLRLLLSPVVLLVACSSKEPASTTPPAAASVEIPRASAAASPGAPRGGAVKMPVLKGKSSFLIDAPLEKIKGHIEETRGELTVDPADLTRTRGQIRFRLASLKTTTFGDAGKDGSQTDHARNWMQVGAESKDEDRSKFEWATFTITSVEVTPTALKNPQEDNGGLGPLVSGKISGDLSLHGVSSKKTVAFSARFRGPAERPTGFSFKTEAPFDLSLKEHDIKPRDGVGSFLQGALEKIGKKIEDRVQVSLEVEAGS